MFINNRDVLIKHLAYAIAYVKGIVDDRDYSCVVSASNLNQVYEEKISALNGIKGIRAIEVSNTIDEDFLSMPSWFLEMVQADKSCAILYSEDCSKAVVITFYDKEADFFVVDYIDLTAVPTGAILRDPLTSLSECIVYKDELLGMYDKVIILQGKEE